MAEKNCPSVAWLSRNNDNRSSGFFTRTCLHTSITICAHSDNHRRHSTPLQPLAPCSQREDILAAAPIRGPFEMDLLCIMWIGHPFLSIRADGNITIKHRANLMLAFIAVLPPQQKYMNVESMSLIFGSFCVWRWVGRYHIEMRGTQITSQKGAFVCWTPHLSQSVKWTWRERLLVSNDISYIHVDSTIHRTGQKYHPLRRTLIMFTVM